MAEIATLMAGNGGHLGNVGSNRDSHQKRVYSSQCRFAQRERDKLMQLTFYGVRGSTASPGPYTQRYGGNTSCVDVKLEIGKQLVLDAGTGIRKLGQNLAQNDDPIFILLSHGHSDHIQGYPFFDPIYQPGRRIRVMTPDPQGYSQLCSLFEQMDGSTFPVRAEDLPSEGKCISEDVVGYMKKEQIHVAHKALNHPGGGVAYRIEEDGVSVAYVTDNELDPPGKVHTTYDEWVAFCSGVDVLIHDAQYTEADMPHKHGWGHSLMSQVRQLAVDAEVGSLVMFHHDPDRSDVQLDEFQRENERFFKGKSAPTKSYCAWEGCELRVTQQRTGTLIQNN